MKLNRAGLTQYAQSTISHFQSQMPSLTHEWQKDLYTRRTEENQQFLDKFEQTPGDSIEKVAKNSKSRGLRKGVGRALLGVAGAAALGAGLVFAGGILGPVLVLGAAASLTVGAAAASEGFDSEANFRHQLKGLNHELESGMKPSIKSGSLPPAAAPSKSTTDDLFDPLNPIGFIHPTSPLNPNNILNR